MIVASSYLHEYHRYLVAMAVLLILNQLCKSGELTCSIIYLGSTTPSGLHSLYTHCRDAGYHKIQFGIQFGNWIVVVVILQLNRLFPTRPIVLLAWTMAGRIAAKV